MPLTDVQIRQVKPLTRPIKLADSAGLYLEVTPSGSRLWRYRYRIGGRENLFAIGEYPAISLAQARAARDEARELVAQGSHPAHVRRQQQAAQLEQQALTFGLVAQEWMSKKKGRWTPYYLSQVQRGMDKDILPRIGELPIRSVSPADVLRILEGASSRGAETVAINLWGWCSQVFRYAVATLRAEADPAAVLRGAIVRPVVTHSRAIDETELAALLHKLDAYGGHRTTSIALHLLLLTFVRTVELRRAEWTEVNFDASEWRIPKEKMKMRRAHVVPLCKQATELLLELKVITGSNRWLFPNHRRPQGFMSATTINRALENLSFSSRPVSGHDFRATASTWLHEAGVRSEVVELQLAHVESNKSKAAYNHAEYLNDRRSMMQMWADRLERIREEGHSRVATSEVQGRLC